MTCLFIKHFWQQINTKKKENNVDSGHERIQCYASVDYKITTQTQMTENILHSSTRKMYASFHPDTMETCLRDFSEYKQ